VQKAKQYLATVPKRTVLPLFKGNFQPTPPQQAFDTKRFTSLAKSHDLKLPPELVDDVLKSLSLAWSTHYRGFSEWYLNFNLPDREREVQMRKEVEADIKIGRVAGPFPRPPFPTPWCNKQPKVCRIFGIPKNKLDWLDPTLRIIFNKSYPPGSSKNDLTPRTDAQLPYHTAQKFLKAIVRLGKNTLMFFADIKAAYKILEVVPNDWNLQVFQIGDEFFVLKVGIFGDVAAGDNWDRFMRVDLALARARTLLELLEYYVDNISHLCGPLPNGKPDHEKASREWKSFLWHYQDLKMPLHDLVQPTTRTESHLGWGIDTTSGTAFIKKERKEHLIETLTTLRSSESWTKADLDSLIGVLSFCATIVQCIKAPLHHLIAIQTLLAKRRLQKFRMQRQTIFVCDWVIYYLKYWKGETDFFRLFGHRTTRTIYVDAGNIFTFNEIWGQGRGAKRQQNTSPSLGNIEFTRSPKPKVPNKSVPLFLRQRSF
jgi:hypothetical protein